LGTKPVVYELIEHIAIGCEIKRKKNLMYVWIQIGLEVAQASNIAQNI
jgi:hypothetical protein